ncbi:MAG: Bug family tripartite tricarboxylate transporter substrate binding protein, partial [Noviherbaspirillum sp.]
MMKRSTFLKFAMAMTVASISTAASAQPGANIRILVGFPAGGAPDAVARAFGEELRQASGAAVIVENRPGASGKLAIDALLSSPADGTTVAVIPSSTIILGPMVLKAANYDVIKDFTALGSLAEYGFGIVAGPASQASDFASFKTWARANPKRSSFASPGQGTPQHFLGAELEKNMGMELLHVPYRGGAAAMADLLSGQVPLLIT